MPREYELIDTTDNDCHDTGSKSEMQEAADALNAADAAANYDSGFGYKVKRNRWVVKPEGYSDANFEAAS